MADVPWREVFSRWVGRTVLTTTGDGAPVSLRVERVEDYTDYAREQGERFSVFLRGPAELPLQQGIHHQARGLSVFWQREYCPRPAQHPVKSLRAITDASLRDNPLGYVIIAVDPPFFCQALGQITGDRDHRFLFIQAIDIANA